MNKFLLLVVTVMSFSLVPTISSAEKKDVTDPVLQQMITTFSPRMPRFIDRHGTDLFVADEPLTRSSFMMALYEYDRSLKMPSKEYATRQEVSDLKSRLAVLERNVSSGTPHAVAGGSGDIAQIINDLAPNMPILLDNSLNNSQVFTKLKNDVLNRQGTANRGSLVPQPEIAEIARRVDRLEKTAGQPGAAVTNGNTGAAREEIAELSRRIDRIERAAPVVAAAPADTASTDELQRTRVQMRRDLVKLEKRIADMEKVSYSGRDAAGESKQYSSLLTKMSFGLSMLAALFIAR